MLAAVHSNNVHRIEVQNKTSKEKKTTSTIINFLRFVNFPPFLNKKGPVWYNKKMYPKICRWVVL